MIKILEKPKPFIRVCEKCGCKFQYEWGDIIIITPVYEIKCPVCGKTMRHVVSDFSGASNSKVPDPEVVPYTPSCGTKIVLDSNIPNTIITPPDMPDLKITYSFD